MAVVNKAKFSINAVASSVGPGYDAQPGEVLTFALETTAGVLSVLFQTYNAADPESPLASLSAPSLVFSNALNSIAPATPVAGVSATMFTTLLDGHSWIVRCTAVIEGETHVFERMVNYLSNKPRKYVPGEVTQNSLRGWADDLDRLVERTLATFAPAAIDTSAAATGDFAAMPSFPWSSGIYVKSTFSCTDGTAATSTLFWFIEAAYSMSAAGVLTQRIAPSAVKKDLSAGALAIVVDPTFVITSNRLVGRVTGIAATTIRWRQRTEVYFSSEVAS